MDRWTVWCSIEHELMFEVEAKDKNEARKKALKLAVDLEQSYDIKGQFETAKVSATHFLKKEKEKDSWTF
jgi:hypothetical protein